jgi:hypothetical protein
MATRTITFCDGCDRQLTGTSQKFCKFRVLTEGYTNAAGESDYGEVNLVFCHDCATNRLLPSLEALAAKTKKGKK